MLKNLKSIKSCFFWQEKRFDESPPFGWAVMEVVD